MKTLLLAGVMAAGLTFPIASQAESNVFGVEVPVVKTEVGDSLKGGHVAEDLGDTFRVQTLGDSTEQPTAETDNREVYYVFGVMVEDGQAI